MGAESALLGSLITTAGGLLMQLIAKIKCVYRHNTENGCEPACACMDGKLERDQDELEVHTVQANDVDLIYVAKKR